MDTAGIIMFVSLTVMFGADSFGVRTVRLINVGGSDEDWLTKLSCLELLLMRWSLFICGFGLLSWLTVNC